MTIERHLGVPTHEAAADPHPQYVLVAGDTMGGALLGVAPTADEHLTRKDYVDDADALLVTKPSSTDNAAVRFNGTGGEIQDSGVIIDDSDNVSGPNTIDVGGNTVTGAGSAAIGTGNTVTATKSLAVGNGNTVNGNANLIGGWGGNIVDAATVFNMGNLIFSNMRKCSYNFISGIVLNANNAQSNAIFGSSNRVGITPLGGVDSTLQSWYNLVAGDGHAIEGNSYACVIGRANKLGDDTTTLQTKNVVIGAYLQTMYSGCVMLGSGVGTGSRLTATADNQFWLGFNSASYTMFADATGVKVTDFETSGTATIGEYIVRNEATSAVDLTITTQDIVTATAKVTITLPASPVSGQTHAVRLDTTKVVTIDGNGNNINGSSTIPMDGLSYPYMVREFTYNSTQAEWMVM